MDPTARFAELVQLPEADVPLDEAALLIASHAHPNLDVVAALRRLDGLAAGVTDLTPAGLAHDLFVVHGFTGNTVDYGDPRNSYLDDVIDRRLGIPITLSLLMVEVGRRVGVRLEGVGMPGHFLVRPAGEDGVWFDPYHEGRCLDADGCRALYDQVGGATRPFSRRDLDPVPTPVVLNRILANLQRTLLRRDPASAVWALRLRLLVPGLSVPERREVAGLLGDLGQFSEAASALDELGAELEGDDARRAFRRATALRARGN